MTDTVSNHIREKDHAVLTCIHDGHDTTRVIREETTLSNRDVNYALDKLEDLGLVETETPEGRVTQVVDGQKRKFKAPRQAELTDAGVAYFTERDGKHTRYRSMGHDELVEQMHDLEQRVADLERAFDTFRQQVLSLIESRD